MRINLGSGKRGLKIRPELNNRHLKEGHGRYFPASGLTFETFDFGFGLDNR